MPSEDRAESDGAGEVQHGVTCDHCGARTFMYERYCHRCNADRWEGDGDD